MTLTAVLVLGSVGDDEQAIGQGSIVTADAETVGESLLWLEQMSAANGEWRCALIVPSTLLDKAMGSLRVDPKALPLGLIAKLGSLVAHVNELDVTSKTAEFDLTAAKSLVADVEVAEWLSTIDPALLPAPRE